MRKKHMFPQIQYIQQQWVLVGQVSLLQVRKYVQKIAYLTKIVSLSCWLNQDNQILMQMLIIFGLPFL